MAHFLAIYHPPRPNFNENATPEEERIIGEHFQNLKSLLAQGKLILAGPCEDASMGIAIFECENEGEARRILESDPAVVKGVFTGEIRPYRVSLLRK